ncbi:PREDICTED: uncharacterized protein LOC109353811 [Lupinus angustifolius]|uniref:uncharacterized protein LOC109353811 n=1 Tax=Lupinus angustifolius TaxID=3871 RepID=UPI00092F2B11|nr:PREDICTED: uncharacterized protein LOC109353811 [Lupinus angustifolius]
MNQPVGFQDSDKTLVCKLNKAIYGLKQAPRQWFERLKGTLHKLGFQVSKCDNSLFIHTSSTYKLYILVYVDDIIVTGSSPPHVKQVIIDLSHTFALKQLGPLDYFLEIEVKHRPNGSLFLSQTKYIKDLLDRANLSSAKSSFTPMASNCKLTKHGTNFFEDPTFFRSIVGALQYATITRPDISYSVNKVCQFLEKPLVSHWTAVKRILKYLQGTQTLGLTINSADSASSNSKASSTIPFNYANSAPSKSKASSTIPLIAFCNADWASDMDDRKSTFGACLYLGPNLVTCWSKKQHTISRSSTEAKYRSLALATQELMWIESLLTELHISNTIPTIFCDNLSTVAMSHNHVLHNRTKHIELDLYFVRDKIQNKTLTIQHIPSKF